jgi:hypothetical protein
MAHEREYVAAVAGMLETSQPPFAVGDLVSGRSVGKSWTGTICGIDGEWLNLTVDSGLLRVPVGDVIHRTRPTANDFEVNQEVTFRLPGWPQDSSACGQIMEIVIDDAGVTTLDVICEGQRYTINPAVWPAGDRLEV